MSAQPPASNHSALQRLHRHLMHTIGLEISSRNSSPQRQRSIYRRRQQLSQHRSFTTNCKGFREDNHKSNHHLLQHQQATLHWPARFSNKSLMWNGSPWNNNWHAQHSRQAPHWSLLIHRLSQGLRPHQSTTSAHQTSSLRLWSISSQSNVQLLHRPPPDRQAQQPSFIVSSNQAWCPPRKRTRTSSLHHLHQWSAFFC